MKKKTKFILLVLLSAAFSTAAVNAFQSPEENLFDDHITIDGRTYKVSPDFEITAGIDKDSPVKLNFSDETHELLSIERLREDDSTSNEMEYYFGIVNAITRANNDWEYRVYVDGVGYLFTRQTRIDERIAFLDKYASVALVTKNGKAIICRVLASNTAIPEKDMFFGMVEQVEKTDNSYTLTIDGMNYMIDAETNAIGTVMIPGTWVFGYKIAGNVRFISVITDEFPEPGDVDSFQGFVSFVGGTGESGAYYITVDNTTMRILPDTAMKGPVSQGDYVSGYRIQNDIMLLDKPTIPFDKSRFEVNYLYAGVISKIAANAFRIDDRIIDYDPKTIISGSFTEGKFAFVSLEGEYADMIYILPDDYSDFNYHTVSGVLNGISSGDSNGKKAVRLDKTVYYIDSDTRISRNLAYDEIGTALYKGLNQISIIDVLPKPADLGHKFSGKISAAHSDPSNGEVIISIENVAYSIPSITAFSDFSDSSRLSSGAIVEGYAYGNEILAIRIVKGAGIFGLLNPPWMEYVLTGGTIFLILVWLVTKAVRNKTSWHTGCPETGPGNTIILHESDGQINRYAADEFLFGSIMAMHEKTISVKIRRGKIIGVR